MELVTILIWALRISLPIVLFIIFFQHQRPKDKQDQGPQGSVYTRSVFLAQRKAPAVRQAAVPAAYGNITLKDPSQAPELFANTRVPRGPPGGRKGGKGEGRERREGGGRKDKERPNREARAAAGEATPGGDSSEASPAAVPVPEQVDDKQNLESLLNYVAFNRQEPQRTFHNEDAPPPPPAQSKPLKPKASDESAEMGAEAVAGATKANADAQLVLKGAIEMRRGGVSRDLYAKMTDSEVEISARTFTLMIEACVQTADLKGASDLLMKMETSGHTPETKLLDQVMDLYSAQKGQRDQEKAAQESIEEENLFRLLGMEADAPRAKLKSTAKVFVPSFGVPPPPSGPRPGEKKKSEDPVEKPADDSSKTEEDSTAAEAKADAVISALTQEEGATRTRLTARAKPFNPGMPVVVVG